MEKKDLSLESLIFSFLDQYKVLFFPKQWSQTFFEYSKNEAFTLFLVYRKSIVNMTEIAEYLSVPLNTVTGIVSRLEKRGMIRRDRASDDKRIVVVKMTETGKESLKIQIEELEVMFQKVMVELTEEEILLISSIAQKIFSLLQKQNSSKVQGNTDSKKVKRIPIE